MIIQVNHAQAEKKLLAAFKSPCKKSDGTLQLISDVLTGTHKTYKYILVTGLLAKATDSRVDALALQAGAHLKGAYDARSLCHKVLVPFERNFLRNALGGSNEPYLNKPARFPQLSETNAVRKGKDKETLKKLIKIFNAIKTSSDAEAYLACALKIIIQQIQYIAKIQDSAISFNPTLIEIYEFIHHFLERSYEGETCAIVVGALEKMFNSSLKENYKVIPHKVNQSGASSKEVGDIDVYKSLKFKYAIEVKDKNFTVHDLEHAFNKIIENNGTKGIFIFGPRASFDRDKIQTRLRRYEKEGFFTLFMDIYNYSRTMLFRIDIDDKSAFIKALMNTAIEINSKDQVKEWIQELLKKLKWK